MERNTSAHQTLPILHNGWQLILRVVFWEWREVLIACTSCGRTVQNSGRASLKVKNCYQLLFSKLLFCTTCGIGIDFFVMLGSNNNINILDQMPLFDNLINGIGPKTQFTGNGREYLTAYYLGDGTTQVTRQLSRQYCTQPPWKMSCLHQRKKPYKRMSNAVLACCNCGFIF